jgi:hypothetical protein
MLEWTYAGINFSAKSAEPWADDGGIECAAHSTLRQRLLETLLTIIVASSEIYYAAFYSKNHIGRSFPREYARERQGRPSVLRRLVLVFYALLWGIEIGFKLASRQFMYILNPCHMVTLIQVNQHFLLFTILNRIRSTDNHSFVSETATGLFCDSL